jgi:hypothetical protein
MKKRRVLLLNAQRLLGESLEHTLRQVDDLEIDGPWAIDDQVIERLAWALPDLVILTDEEIAPEALSRLTAQILDRYPDLPVFRVTLQRNVLQEYSSHTLPASSAELIDRIHRLPVQKPGGHEG